MLFLIFSIKLPLIILVQTLKEFEKPIKSVPPWLLITGESSPIKTAEGTADFITSELKKAMTGNFIGKISSLLNMSNLKKFKKRKKIKAL